MSEVNVRYYAGMVDRAGLPEESYERVETLSELRAAIGARHGQQIEAPLQACTFLVDGQAVLDEGAQIGSTVEILPPFAGG